MAEREMPLVETFRDGGVAILRIARPPANAIDLALVEAIGKAIEAAEPSEPLVLTGSADVFSAGIDVKTVPRYSLQERAAMLAEINRTVERLYGFPAPTVAAVNGHAIGGGLVLALACDFRLAADRPCRLGLTEVTAGIAFPAGPMIVVESELDRRAARTLTLTGRIYDTAGAAALGVIDELHAPEELLPRAIERARSLAVPAYGVVKRQLRGPALERMRRVVESGEDPVLRSWIARSEQPRGDGSD